MDACNVTCKGCRSVHENLLNLCRDWPSHKARFLGAQCSWKNPPWVSTIASPQFFFVLPGVYTCLPTRRLQEYWNPFSLVVKDGKGELDWRMSSLLHHPSFIRNFPLPCLIARQRVSFLGLRTDLFFWSMTIGALQPSRKGGLQNHSFLQFPARLWHLFLHCLSHWSARI